MGVVSNKVDITQLQISGGGGGDPTIPGRVSVLENEMTGVYASINQISTVELPKVYSSINEISTVELPKVYSSINEISTVELPRVYASINANTQTILTGSVNMADKVKMNNTQPIRFGVDGDGNYGYYKVGADTVTPFLISNVINTALNTNSNAGTSISFAFTNKRPKYFVYSANGNIAINSSSMFFNLLLGKVNDDDTITINNIRIQHGTSSAPYNGIVSNILTATWDPITWTLTFTGISDYTFTAGLCRIYY